MTGAQAPVVPGQVAERYLSRIETHLIRLGECHDPLGHLFAIERLARAARAEWWEAQRQTQPARHGR
jgi:hypothetical protein